MSSLHVYLNRPCNDSIKQLISSFGYDLIHGVTRSKVVTLKRFLLGVCLHNINGLKLPIRVLSHLGHCIDYDLVCDIETAKAEVAQKMYENNLTQLTQISPTEAPILTYWWADNFNQTLESYSRHGVINSTHIVEFSEPKEAVAMLDISLNIPRNTKRRSSYRYHQTAKIWLQLWWIKRKNQLLFRLQFLKQPRRKKRLIILTDFMQYGQCCISYKLQVSQSLHFLVGQLECNKTLWLTLLFRKHK